MSLINKLVTDDSVALTYLNKFIGTNIFTYFIDSNIYYTRSSLLKEYLNMNFYYHQKKNSEILQRLGLCIAKDSTSDKIQAHRQFNIDIQPTFKIYCIPPRVVAFILLTSKTSIKARDFRKSVGITGQRRVINGLEIEDFGF